MRGVFYPPKQKQYFGDNTFDGKNSKISVDPSVPLGNTRSVCSNTMPPNSFVIFTYTYHFIFKYVFNKYTVQIVVKVWSDTVSGRLFAHGV